MNCTITVSSSREHLPWEILVTCLRTLLGASLDRRWLLVTQFFNDYWNSNLSSITKLYLKRNLTKSATISRHTCLEISQLKFKSDLNWLRPYLSQYFVRHPWEILLTKSASTVRNCSLSLWKWILSFKNCKVFNEHRIETICKTVPWGK